MNRIKRWSIVVTLFFFVQTVYCQKRNYIATDSLVNSGITLIKGGARNNAQFINVKTKTEEVKYYPDQLLEYGFENGAVFVSKGISVSGQTKQVFLERLEHGKINLYYYIEGGVKTFFLERDSTVFVEIKKDDDFRKIISEYTNDIDWKASQVMLVRYNRKSLSKLISIYNNDLNIPFPFLRFGIIVGANSTFLTIPSNIFREQLRGISFMPNSRASFGIFGDLPIEMSDFSVNLGLNFSKSEFSANSTFTGSSVDVDINYSSLNIPILLRYTIPYLVWRPFVNAGVIYSYHFNSESNIYETIIDQNVSTINEVRHKTLISESMLGYSFGLGLQRNLNYKKIAALEFRFNQLYGSMNTLNKSQFEILTSLSF